MGSVSARDLYEGWCGRNSLRSESLRSGDGIGSRARDEAPTLHLSFMVKQWSHAGSATYCVRGLGQGSHPLCPSGSLPCSEASSLLSS